MTVAVPRPRPSSRSESCGRACVAHAASRRGRRRPVRGRSEAAVAAAQASRRAARCPSCRCDGRRASRCQSGARAHRRRACARHGRGDQQGACVVTPCAPRAMHAVDQVAPPCSLPLSKLTVKGAAIAVKPTKPTALGRTVERMSDARASLWEQRAQASPAAAVPAGGPPWRPARRPTFTYHHYRALLQQSPSGPYWNAIQQPRFACGRTAAA